MHELLRRYRKIADELAAIRRELASTMLTGEHRYGAHTLETTFNDPFCVKSRFALASDHFAYDPVRRGFSRVLRENGVDLRAIVELSGASFLFATPGPRLAIDAEENLDYIGTVTFHDLLKLVAEALSP